MFHWRWGGSLGADHADFWAWRSRVQIRHHMQHLLQAGQGEEGRGQQQHLGLLHPSNKIHLRLRETGAAIDRSSSGSGRRVRLWIVLNVDPPL